MLIYSYPHTGRKLSRLITAILKSGLAYEVKRLNYVKSYTLKDNKISKQEERILMILPSPDQQQKLINFIIKQDPEIIKLDHQDKL